MSQEQTMHHNQLRTLCIHCQYLQEMLQENFKKQRALTEQRYDLSSQDRIKELEQLHHLEIKRMEDCLCLFCKDPQRNNIPGDIKCHACYKWQEKKATDEDKLRTELAECKQRFKNFKERMSLEVSAEIGGSGTIFEDITNPCRASELEKAYKKLEMTLMPKLQGKSKEKEGESVNEEEEKEQIKRMIKAVFTKATNDMKKKKEDLESLFNINNDTRENNNKQLQCKKMAVQGLQMLIFWEDCKHYQNTFMQLGKTTPDFVSKLADECYKQGCLMALCDPPLILDWDKKDSDRFLPPILKLGVECVSGGNVIQQQDVNTCTSTRV